VGRLVLYLGRYRDPERQVLSDYTCTALQLANHWQDIQVDLTRLNRIYLPMEDMERHGYGEADLRAQHCDSRFARLMQLEIGRTRDLFLKGLKLADLVDSRLALEIELFGRCGLELLDRIEAVKYDVFRRRPTVTRWARVKLLVSCWQSRRSPKTNP
jgi:phytoene/squalene synthetase